MQGVKIRWTLNRYEPSIFACQNASHEWTRRLSRENGKVEEDEEEDQDDEEEDEEDPGDEDEEEDEEHEEDEEAHEAGGSLLLATISS